MIRLPPHRCRRIGMAAEINRLRRLCLDPLPDRAGAIFGRPSGRPIPFVALDTQPVRCRRQGTARNDTPLQQLFERGHERGSCIAAAAAGTCRRCNRHVLVCRHRKIGHGSFTPHFLSPPTRKSGAIVIKTFNRLKRIRKIGGRSVPHGPRLRNIRPWRGSFCRRAPAVPAAQHPEVDFSPVKVVVTCNV